MKKNARVFILLFLVFLGACDLMIEIPKNLKEIEGDYNGFLVRYKSDASMSKVNSSLYQVMGEYTFAGAPLLKVSMKKGVSYDELKAYFEEQEDVLYFEPNYIRKPFANSYDDPFWEDFQYAKELCFQESAYAKYGIGAFDTFAAVVDTGLDFTHEDLKESVDEGRFYGWSAFDRTGTQENSEYELLKKRREISINGSTFNVLDYLSITDFSNWDQGGHGSHVVGILGAVGNNDKGIVGVCPSKLAIALYKVFAVNPGSYSSIGGGVLETYSSLLHLVDMRDSGQLKYSTTGEILSVGQTIPINFSLGGRGLSLAEVEFINFAADNNILLIAASGNDGFMLESYPAALSATMSIGSVDSRGIKSSFSTGSDRLSVVAPGSDIYSLKSNVSNGGGFYVYNSGTSMATPYVTGLAAYLLTFDRDLTAAELRTVIEDSAQDLGDLGHDPWYGYGLVNVEKAVEKVKSGEIFSKYMKKSLEIHLTDKTEHQVVLYKYEGDRKVYFGVSIATKESAFIARFPMLLEGRYEASISRINTLRQVQFNITSTDIQASEGKTINL